MLFSTSTRQLLFGLCLLALATPAYAYIDPNIGGQLYQMLYPIIAVLLGVVAFFRQWITAIWLAFAQRLKAAFKRTRP